jgi:signal transduction histidine kinase
MKNYSRLPLFTETLPRTSFLRRRRTPHGLAPRATSVSAGMFLAIGVGIAFWLTVSPNLAELRAVQVGLIALYVLVVFSTRSYPQVAFLLLFGITVTGWLTGVTQEPFIMASWALYRVTFLSGKARRLKLIASVTSVGFLLVLVSAEAPSSDFMILQILVSVTFLFGAWLMGVQGRAEVEQREQAAESRKRTALLEQRADVSRELHDILSHTLSRIGMQAAVSREVNSKDLPEVLNVLGAIEVDSRLALNEVRSLLVSVKSGVDSVSQPTMSKFDSLVASSSSLGIELDVQVDLPESLPTIVDVNLYRILQEIVTNIGKHALDAKGTIRVGPGSPEVLSVHSQNTPLVPQPNTNPGIGLEGICERAEMLGGSASVEREENLFSVTITIPLSATATEETHD